MLKRALIKFLIAPLFFVSALSSYANAAEVTKEQIKGLDEQVQDIKKDVLN